VASDRAIEDEEEEVVSGRNNTRRLPCRERVKGEDGKKQRVSTKLSAEATQGRVIGNMPVLQQKKGGEQRPGGVRKGASKKTVRKRSQI